MKSWIFVAFVLTLGACNQISIDKAPQQTHPKISPAASSAEIMPPGDAQKEMFGNLANYVGMTFSGAPTGESTEQFVDVQKWEWALGGKAILIRHAIVGGSYGGDTYVYKDAKTGKLTYVYVTNSGYHTVGEMIPNENGWIAEEAVSGHESIARVRSISVIDDDGNWNMNSEYLTSGEWVPGHAFIYRPTNDPLPALNFE